MANNKSSANQVSPEENVITLYMEMANQRHVHFRRGGESKLKTNVMNDFDCYLIRSVIVTRSGREEEER